MNLLLAADGSDYTRRAAEYLVKLVAQMSKPASIVVLNVHAPLPYAGAAAAAGKDAVDDYQRDECEKALAVASRVLDKAGLKYKAEWVVGDVAAIVADRAKALGTDMVVMGSHGHGALMSVAMGSTATKIIAASKVPVLIVR